MAGTVKQQSTATSPASSEDIESHHATPATKLSAFSPDDTRDFTTSGSRIVRIPAYDLKITTAKSTANVKQASSASLTPNDPFVSASPLQTVTTKSSVEASKLSPVAATFTPATNFDSPLDGSQKYGSYLGAPTSKPSAGSSLLHKNSLTNKVLLSASEEFGREAQKTFNFSVDESTSRSLMIETGTHISLEHFKEYFKLERYPSLLAIANSELAAHGVVYVKFADIRDADKVFSHAQHGEIPWPIKHVAPQTFAVKYRPGGFNILPVSKHEGQVSIVASYSGIAHQLDVGSLSAIVKGALEYCGELMTFSLDEAEPHKVVFRAEYFNLNCVDSAILYVEGAKVAMCTLSISRYQPDIEANRQTFARGPVIIGQDDSALDKAFNGMNIGDYHEPNESFVSQGSSPYVSNHPVQSVGNHNRANNSHVASPWAANAPSYGSTMPLSGPAWNPSPNPYNGYSVPSTLWSQYNPGTIGQERGSAMLAPQRHPIPRPHPKPHARFGSRQQHDFSGLHHNVVDVDRIQAGLDVRTTIMLRNIPNKVDQKMLKEIVDESSHGKYDFMYLRIDFANNCNVGYAFINFEDPIYIIDFVNTRAGKRWNRFNSDKVAEVSYATIQGRDCLVAKFRNSSVMYENEKFRPKLFTTGAGPLAGAEELFPGADNASKMRRSLENAGQIGLFAPRAAQNYRDEQRRRRSQYDRGTRLAEVEDSYDSNYYAYRQQPPNFRSSRPLGFSNGQYPTGHGSRYH